MSVGPDGATRFKKTAPPFQRGKNQQKRCSCGRETALDAPQVQLALPSAGGVTAQKVFHFDLCADPSFTEDQIFEAVGAKALLDQAPRGAGTAAPSRRGVFRA